MVKRSVFQWRLMMPLRTPLDCGPGAEVYCQTRLLILAANVGLINEMFTCARLVQTAVLLMLLTLPRPQRMSHIPASGTRRSTHVGFSS
jgi:hypothetical protein